MILPAIVEKAYVIFQIIEMNNEKRNFYHVTYKLVKRVWKTLRVWMKFKCYYTLFCCMKLLHFARHFPLWLGNRFPLD